MTITEYPHERLAAQPIGYWSGAANDIIVGSLRAALAEEKLTQPHWWILNHLTDSPGEWTRSTLTAKLTPFDTQDTDFATVFADLDARGWIAEADHHLVLTEAGVAGFEDARTRNLKVHHQMHDGISPDEYVAALNVLRRMITNLGGDSDLP